MKISIITVCYNAEKTIRESILSVISQSYNDIEYIIIDGNSTDNTLQIINQYKYAIPIIISEPDNGIYDAMNKGIKKASGEIIGILNSDDTYPDSEVLKNVMSFFLKDSPDILYGDLIYVKNNDINKIVRRWKSSPYSKNFFDHGNVPPHPALFVKSEVYREAGYFDLQYKLASDYEFMLRIFKKHQFKSVYINRLMVKMQLGGATNKSLKNIIKGNKEILKAWQNNDLKVPLLLMPIRIIKRLLQFF